MRRWVVVAVLCESCSALKAGLKRAAPPRNSQGLRRGVRWSDAGPATDAADDDASSWESTRSAVAVLSALGAAETAYLTFAKVTGGAAICGAAACADVLTGPYSAVAGVPLSLLGCGAYTAVFALAVAPKAAGAQLDEPTRLPLAMATAAMAAFSTCLVALLVLKLQVMCVFCFTSAALSAAMSAAVARKSSEKRLPSVGAAFASAAVASMLFLYAESSLDASKLVQMADNVAVQSSTKAGLKAFAVEPPKVKTASTPRTLRLAKHLEETGAKMYGAYWCSHCFTQKELFGAEALVSLPYIECAADGARSERTSCQARDVAGYPTWDIGGKLYPGEKSIAELEALSQLAPP
ncbi:vitamin K epoxide reductase family-domain-containing protein [Pelagophyceae sp. CCMP2097]|nr:vitamin K epoxide reductase family-domain-containing protein [Pelagophyceae sp. CCMP2097]